MNAVVRGGSSASFPTFGQVIHSKAIQPVTMTSAPRRKRLNKRPDCTYIDHMKRLLVLLAIATALAAPAFSFDPSRHNGNRIAVLQAPIYNGGEYEI
jgi:hypothetical protein